MTSKIRIVSGFASPREVAEELGVSKTELQAIEEILNKPAVRKKSSCFLANRYLAHLAYFGYTQLRSQLMPAQAMTGLRD
jgi:hypothetical protein